MLEINYTLVLIAAFFAVASPGPATLAIASCAMGKGRVHSMVLALGVTTGSLIWSLSAALGLGALIYSQPWMLDSLRFAGAGYLLFMAYKSWKSALRQGELSLDQYKVSGLWGTYYRGLTNPKAALFFISLYAIVIPVGSTMSDVLTINALIVTQGFLVFQSYAILFSIAKIRLRYIKLRRWFEAAFGFVFAVAGIKVFTI